MATHILHRRTIVSVLLFSTLLYCGPNSAQEKPSSRDCPSLTVPADMKCIPGGPFIRGSDRESIEEDTKEKVRDEAPQSTVIVDVFFMDTNETTYSEYQECFRAKGCSAAGPVYKDYDGPRMPMMGLNWFQARDYCKWKGKRLPTEAEWEKAARGETGDLYPWGNEPADCTRAIIQEKGQKGCGTGKTWNVGSRPVYRYGLNDMAGNSWEWVNDWYSPSYTQCGAGCAGPNPQGPCAGLETCPGNPEKIVRGGSWWWDAEYTLGSNRRPHFPSNRPYHHFGFRCAKSPS